MKWFLTVVCGLAFFIVAYNFHGQANTATLNSSVLTPPATKASTALPAAILTSIPVSPTPTPFALSGQDPADLDVIRYIFNRRRPDVGISTDDFFENLVTGEYTDFILQSADVNGDRQPEILVSGQIYNLSAYAAILTHSPDNSWQEIFYIEDIGFYCADTQLNVNTERVTIDFLTCWGGTGYLQSMWEQHWVKCEKNNCSKVWSAQLFETSRVIHTTNSRYYSIATVEQPNNLTVRLVTRQFGVADIPSMTVERFPIETPRRIVGPDIEKIYRWAGDAYQLESEKQLVPGIEIVREFDEGTFEAFRPVDNILRQPFENSQGSIYDNLDKVYEARASFLGVPVTDNLSDVVWESENYLPDVATRDGTGQKIAAFISAKNRPLCRLTVQQQNSNSFELIGREDVPCTAKFTRLFWVDIDKDGVDELLLLTIPPDSDGFQRIHIYRVEGGFSEIVTKDGVMNGPDGVGIKWENSRDNFKLLLGLAFVDGANCPKDLSCATLDRTFEEYIWDSKTNSFQSVEMP